MKCVDCHYLCAINGDILPRRERAQLRRKEPEAFTWLACAKSIAQFTHKLPQAFDQVLKERKCKGYRECDPRATLAQMWQREIRRIPMWYKVAVIMTVLLVIGAVVGAMLQYIS